MRRTGFTQDPDFNTITVKRIRGSGVNPITILTNTDIQAPAILAVSQLLISQAKDKNSGFILDIDEDNPNALLIKKVINDGIIESGILYDTEFNRPEGNLYISPLFSLPSEKEQAYDFLINHLNYILCITTETEQSSFTLPSLSIFGGDDYKQIRISNSSLLPIQILFEDKIIVEMFQERISLVWCKRDGYYSWIWVP